MYVDETAPASPVAARDANRDPFAPGAVVAGRYTILRFIAAGGMGAVYEAVDRVLGTRVALKAVKDDGSMSSASVRRLVREIALVRKITHPNICRVHDVGEHAGRAFLTMELLTGETLASRLRRGPLPMEDLERTAGQLVAGLAALHAAAVIHRDFKSANVIVTGSGPAQRAIITDFGLAREVTGQEVSSLTGEGALLGTPAYMAPEQVEGRPATTASDIYALGVVLFELATGALPFSGDTPMALATARLTRPAPRARSLRADLPAAWDAAIARCLEREPARRPADVRAVLPGHARRRNLVTLVAIAGGVAVVTGAVALGVAVAPGNPPAPAACPAASSLTYDVWGPPTRARISRRFLASDQRFVRETWRMHALQLDREVASWARLWDQACTSPDKDTDRLLHAQLLTCLEERLFELSALAANLDSPSVDVEQFALGSIGEWLLVPASVCASSALLREQMRLPPRAARPAFQAVMDELHRLRYQLRLAFNVGIEIDVEAAMAALAALAVRARELEARPAAGQIDFWRGTILRWLGRWSHADEVAAELVTEGERIGDDRLVLQGLALRVDVGANRPPPHDAAAGDRMLARASEILDRLGHPPHLGMWVAEARAAHSWRLGRHGEHGEASRRLVAIDHELGLPLHAVVDGRRRALVRAGLGHADEMLPVAKEILAASGALSGQDSQPYAQSLRVLAEVFELAGEAPTALRMMEQSLEVSERIRRERPLRFAAERTLAAGYAGRIGDRPSMDRHLRAAIADHVADGASGADAAARVLRALRARGLRQAAERAVELTMGASGSGAVDVVLEDERRELAAEAGDGVAARGDPRRRAVAEARQLVTHGQRGRGAAALTRLIAGLPPDLPWMDPDRAELEAWLGLALIEEAPARAIEHLTRALSMYVSCCRAGGVTAQQARLGLAEALWRTGGDREEARRHAQVARDRLARMGPALAAAVARADAWLASHPAGGP